MPKTLNTDDFAPRYATRIDANGYPVTVRVDLTPALAVMAATTARRRVVVETAEAKRAGKAAKDGATWGKSSDGASWGELAPVTPIRPAAADDVHKAA